MIKRVKQRRETETETETDFTMDRDYASRILTDSRFLTAPSDRTLMWIAVGIAIALLVVAVAVIVAYSCGWVGSKSTSETNQPQHLTQLLHLLFKNPNIPHRDMQRMLWPFVRNTMPPSQPSSVSHYSSASTTAPARPPPPQSTRAQLPRFQPSSAPSINTGAFGSMYEDTEEPMQGTSTEGDEGQQGGIMDDTYWGAHGDDSEPVSVSVHTDDDAVGGTAAGSVEVV